MLCDFRLLLKGAFFGAALFVKRNDKNGAFMIIRKPPEKPFKRAPAHPAAQPLIVNRVFDNHKIGVIRKRVIVNADSGKRRVGPACPGIMKFNRSPCLAGLFLQPGVNKAGPSGGFRRLCLIARGNWTAKSDYGNLSAAAYLRHAIPQTNTLILLLFRTDVIRGAGRKKKQGNCTNY